MRKDRTLDYGQKEKGPEGPLAVLQILQAVLPNMRVTFVVQTGHGP